MRRSLKPVVTEASMAAAKSNRYTFAVPLDVNKNTIRGMVEKAFGVEVLKVKTMIVKGKTKRNLRSRRTHKLPDWKKAVVAIKEGQKIEIFGA